ncbi:MAG: Zn-ribbon domain-containing OB-fold protein [Deltaproteobacteria bacterium]|nr:Zn-ribbon domain-containing OB-fold protein [Deltaproteobacteria bacterium]
MEYKLTFDQYQQGLEQGKFLGVSCKSCNAVIFPPGAVCRDCGSTDLEPIELSGDGTLRTFTVIRVAPEGKKPPYVVAMAELDEGPWAFGNLVDTNPETADMALIGKRVRLGSHIVKGDTYSTDDIRVLTFALKEV